METQRLETISQSLPLLPSGATPPSLAFSHLAFFLLSASLAPPHFPLAGPPLCTLSSLPPPPSSVSSPADVPCSPCTAPSLHSTGDLGKGAEGRRGAHRDKPTGSQAAPEERQIAKSPCPLFLPRSETCHPTFINDTRDVGGRSGKKSPSQYP